MTLPKDELQLAALSVVAGADEPVGSLRLAQAMTAQGLEIAEATAGRYLHALQRAGYVTVPGPKRGRVITRKGLEQVELLQRRSLLLEHGRQFAETSEIADLDDLIAVLQVRRGVEAEGASLAAQEADRATAEAILAEARRHVQVVSDGSLPTAQDSSSFHLSIAIASGNPVLISVARTLIDPANERRLRSGEDVSVGRNVVAAQAHDHVAIAEAIRDGDADLAGSLMRAHLDGFIADARGFRDTKAVDVTQVVAL